jgi:hypothetical protein
VRSAERKGSSSFKYGGREKYSEKRRLSKKNNKRLTRNNRGTSVSLCETSVM